jgi:pyruvate ferredoxin oxidoreductase beta subunit
MKDLHEKAEKAIYMQGPAFLNVLAPCPRGWRYEASRLMEVTKLAVDTCVWPMFEVINGVWHLSYEPKVKKPVEEYLKVQGRFKHLFKPENRHLIDEIQAEVDKNWEELKKKCNR